MTLAPVRAQKAVQRAGSKSPAVFVRGAVSATVPAVVRGYALNELAAGMTQGARRVIVSKLDLDLAGFPTPPRKDDEVWLRGAKCTVRKVDAEHRSFIDVYDIEVLGV